MTILTLPAPLAGRFQLRPDTVAWTHLAGDRFLIVFQQEDASRVYAQVVRYPKSLSPTTVDDATMTVDSGPTVDRQHGLDTGRARLVRQTLARPVPLRVVGFGDKAVVLYFDSGRIDAQFLAIDAADAIAEGTVTPLLADVFAALDEPGGPYLAKLDATHLRCFTNNAIRTRHAVHVLTVDPAAETIAVASTDANHPLDTVTVRPIPGSTGFYEAYAHDDGKVARIIDGQGRTIASHDTTSATSAIFGTPVTATRVVSVQAGSDGTKLRLVEDGAQASQPVTCTANALANPREVLPLDNGFLMAVGETATGLSCMVLWSSAGWCSPETDRPGGLALATAPASDAGLGDGFVYFSAANRYHPSYHRLDDATFLYWFILDNRLGFKVISRPDLE